jgi:hypothetical protein
VWSDLGLIKDASRALVGTLRTGDRAAVVDVKQSIRLPQLFTEERGQVIAAIEPLRARGSTAMYDGLYTSLREFSRERRQRAEMRRQALVLVSDGLDNASHVTFDDVTELARRLDVTIYTIALRSGEFLDPAQRHAWRRWTSRWLTPKTPGRYTLMARARDANGSGQPGTHDPSYGGYVVNHPPPIEVFVGDTANGSDEEPRQSPASAPPRS